MQAAADQDDSRRMARDVTNPRTENRTKESLRTHLHTEHSSPGRHHLNSFTTWCKIYSTWCSCTIAPSLVTSMFLIMLGPMTLILLPFYCHSVFLWLSSVLSGRPRTQEVRCSRARIFDFYANKQSISVRPKQRCTGCLSRCQPSRLCAVHASIKSKLIGSMEK